MEEGGFFFLSRSTDKASVHDRTTSKTTKDDHLALIDAYVTTSKRGGGWG